jgi:nitroimidazol reductase NimA-like FMN-containing flavoprotein (pyridoxamine 5'-phosphate oxidase superfamily)
VRRIAARARYDADTIAAILDAGYVCHLGFVDEGFPVVIPMSYWRDGGFVYFHSARAGRLGRAVALAPVCLTVTLFDGLVLGHSATNHSMNYRSVVVHGVPEAIDGLAEKMLAMRAFMEHVLPGRYAEVRPIAPEEAERLTVFRLPLTQASAKVRDEFPDQETVAPDWPAWIGIIPARTVFDAPLADPQRNRIEPPSAAVAGFASRDR